MCISWQIGVTIIICITSIEIIAIGCKNNGTIYGAAAFCNEPILNI